jgi:capsular exopolysaccharide synthesis family protein
MSEALNLTTISDPLSPISEAYRTLRTNLQFAALERALHTVLLTCPSAEGKHSVSNTLANLAVSLAQVDQRVILVDSDLRQPSLHRIFGLGNERGLTTWLSSEEEVSAPPLDDTPVQGLRLLPSGPLLPRARDLLSSKRMGQVIEALKAEADMVLLAAPPVLDATDAAILATKVDGVVLVITSGETKREQAQAAMEQLQRLKANLVGAVLANASVDTQRPSRG